MAQIRIFDATLAAIQSSHLNGQVELDVILNSTLAVELSTALKTLQTGDELKIVLPTLTANAPLPVAESWVVFVKVSTASERSMVAHPTQSEWVGSVLLSNKRMAWLCERLTQMIEGRADSFLLDDFMRLSYPSNLRLRFKLASV